MGKAYSLDLRVRISDYISSGHSRRAAGRVFGVSASTAIRLAAGVRDRGSLAPLVQGHAAGTAGKLTPHRVFLLEIVAAEPDISQIVPPVINRARQLFMRSLDQPLMLAQDLTFSGNHQLVGIDLKVDGAVRKGRGNAVAIAHFLARDQ